MTTTVRISWSRTYDNSKMWNEVCVWAIEMFGLPGDRFIATANVLDTIPGPLRDRMEVIELAGYTEEEKLEIARRYLVSRQLEANGLEATDAIGRDGVTRHGHEFGSRQCCIERRRVEAHTLDGCANDRLRQHLGRRIMRVHV